MEHEPKRKKPVDWDELYPGRFLKAGLFGDKKVTLEITDVDAEALEGDKGKKVKGVVSFRGTDMQLALNRTNGVCLREMFGRKVQEWIGKRVTLFASEWNGEPCIRVWGSPDIASDMNIEVALPKRKPTRMTMHAMKNGKADKAAPARQRDPGDEGDGVLSEEQERELFSK
jgi:hypothetical protein